MSCNMLENMVTRLPDSLNGKHKKSNTDSGQRMPLLRRAWWLPLIPALWVFGCASHPPAGGVSPAGLDTRPPPVKGEAAALMSSSTGAQDGGESLQTVSRQPQPQERTTEQAEAAQRSGRTDVRPAAAQSGRISHAAVGCRVEASSSNMKFPGEGPPSALVDGDLATRWSSEYRDNQSVTLTLAQAAAVDKLRLHWEAAAAAKYSVALSEDGKTWETVHADWRTSAKPEPRVDEIPLKGRKTLMIRLDLQTRANPDWGFSLFEIEVVPLAAIP